MQRWTFVRRCDVFANSIKMLAAEDIGSPENVKDPWTALGNHPELY